jgi:serine/threonine protein kinase
LKPQNLLINQNMQLKIADFGLARAFMLPVPKYTHEVVTVWYRPPEILLGSELYSIPVDQWGVGCIIAEMATGQPLFAGDSEIDTVFKVFQKLGTPTEAMWPELSTLPDFKPTFPKWVPKGWANIRNTAAQVGPDGIDLLDQLMQYNPGSRISARRALIHQYFYGAERYLPAVGGA